MLVFEVVATGLVATLAGDAWHVFLRRAFGLPVGSWASAGRWVCGFRHGRLIDVGLRNRPPVAHENAIGWAFHYAVGLLYAALYLAGLRVIDPALAPTLANALLFGLVSLAAPMLFMKPALGGGLFGWRAARPWRGFWITVSTHLVFGAGLYAGWCLA
ncbi:DUF2938 domain-containing protein [Novosphingobium sp. 1949]|uniref:DUF2938 domain-containing protein n=1 Tax=Novosphingobium organovorum TaxID=2930092 RepID=A0ABT0BCG6_9SPHN|nr:DUF2938 family protein [Novosphingobium organovorum]MCJ2182519.1 DUF2938 domain-containing protein [Novosphingobium organovorum]